MDGVLWRFCETFVGILWNMMGILIEILYDFVGIVWEIMRRNGKTMGDHKEIVVRNGESWALMHIS